MVIKHVVDVEENITSNVIAILHGHAKQYVFKKYIILYELLQKQYSFQEINVESIV